MFPTPFFNNPRLFQPPEIAVSLASTCFCQRMHAYIHAGMHPSLLSRLCTTLQLADPLVLRAVCMYAQHSYSRLSSQALDEPIPT